jgi:hypothetical protein
MYCRVALTALRSSSQIIRDQYEALKLKNKIEKDLTFGVKTELIKLYSSENKSWSQNLWWLGMAVALTAVIFNTIGQLIIQDALYAPVIKPISCKFLPVSNSHAFQKTQANKESCTSTKMIYIGH